jgi:hypothetical protein
MRKTKQIPFYPYLHSKKFVGLRVITNSVIKHCVLGGPVNFIPADLVKLHSIFNQNDIFFLCILFLKLGWLNGCSD